MASTTTISPSSPKRQLDELDHHESESKRTAERSFDELSTECTEAAARGPSHLARFAQSIADRPYDVALMPPLDATERPWGKLLQERKPANAFACAVSTGVRTLTSSISCIALIVMPVDKPTEPAPGELCGAYAYFGAYAAGDGPVDLSAQQSLFGGNNCLQIGNPLSADSILWSRSPHHHRVRLGSDLLAALRTGKGHPQLEQMCEYLRKHMATGENPGSVAVENDPVLYTLAFDVSAAMTFLRGMIVEAEIRESKEAKHTTEVLMPPTEPGGKPTTVHKWGDGTKANAYFVEVSDPAQNLDRSVTDDQGFSSAVLVVTHASYGNEDGSTPTGEVIGDYAYVGPSRQRGRIMALQQRRRPVSQHVIGTRVLVYQNERMVNGRENVDWFWGQSKQWHSRVRLRGDLLCELRSGRVPRNLDTLLDYLRRVVKGRDGDQTLYDVCTAVENLAEVATIAPAATTATIQQAYRPEAETIAPAADERVLCREITSVHEGGYFDRLYVPCDLLVPEEHAVLDKMNYCSWDSGVSWAEPDSDVMALLGLRLGFSGLPEAARELPKDERKAIWKRENELAKLAITDLSKVRVDRPSACAIDWC